MPVSAPKNQFGGRCHSCHKWVEAGSGSLDGRDEIRGRWRIICGACFNERTEAATGADAADDRHEWSYDGDFTERLREYLESNHPGWAQWKPHQPTIPRCLATLGLAPPVTRQEIQARFRQLCMEHHPDHGGDARKFIEITQAKDKALLLVGGR